MLPPNLLNDMLICLTSSQIEHPYQIEIAGGVIVPVCAYQKKNKIFPVHYQVSS